MARAMVMMRAMLMVMVMPMAMVIAMTMVMAMAMAMMMAIAMVAIRIIIPFDSKNVIVVSMRPAASILGIEKCILGESNG